mgnify:CR=1 FL=1
MEPNIGLILRDTTPLVLDIQPGFFANMLGSTAARTVNVANGAGAQGLDAGTTVNIEGASDAFTFARNGTTLEVRDSEGNVTAQIAGGTETSTVRFADGATDLGIDASAGALTFAGQTFSDGDSVAGSAAGIDLDAGDTSASFFDNSSGSEVVNLDSLGGTAFNPETVDASGRAVVLTDSQETVSFTDVANFGADDEIELSGVNADDVSVSSSNGNTNIQFENGAGDVSNIQLTDVSGFFTDVASFNSANMGDITFTENENSGDDEGNGDNGDIAVIEIDLDAEGGTPAAPANVDAGGRAFNFTDALATQSFTEIANFGADDEITLSGVNADDVVVNVSSGDTTIEFADDAGTVSTVTLLGVSGFFVDVASFNSADLGDITFTENVNSGDDESGGDQPDQTVSLDGAGELDFGGEFVSFDASEADVKFTTSSSIGTQAIINGFGPGDQIEFQDVPPNGRFTFFEVRGSLDINQPETGDTLFNDIVVTDLLEPETFPGPTVVGVNDLLGFDALVIA